MEVLARHSKSPITKNAGHCKLQPLRQIALGFLFQTLSPVYGIHCFKK